MSVHTWNSGASTDMNSGLNYTPSGTMDSTWDLVWDNTSAINSTATATLTVNSTTVAANYAGTWTGSSRTFNITGNVAFNHATISPVMAAGTLNIGGSFSINKSSSMSSNVTINLTGSSSTITYGVAATGTQPILIFSGNGTFVIGIANITFQRIKMAGGKTYTFPVGVVISTNAGTSGTDATGTLGNIVTWVSSVPGTQASFQSTSSNGPYSLSYMNITDINGTGNAATLWDCSDGTSVRGSNVINIRWPASIYYQDYGKADDTGSGLLMSTAKKTHQAALNLLSNAGDILICRRATTEIPSATLTYPALANGTPSNPIKIMGMPRASLAFTGTWVNNLNAIYNLNITAKPEQHIGRWVKNNSDGNDYLITDIIEQVAYTGRTNGGFAVGDTIVGATSTASWVVLQDTDLGSNTGLLVVWKWATALGRLLYSNGENLQKAGQTRGVANGAGALCFCIDRPYPGSSAAGAAGTLEADEDYAWSQTLSSGQGADLLSTWTADAHDMPIINWNGSATAYDNPNRLWYEIRNFCVRGAAGSTIQNITNGAKSLLKLIGIYASANSGRYGLGGDNTLINRCVIDAVGAVGNPSLGINATSTYCIIMNSAIHHFINCLSVAAGVKVILNNVNLGVEKESTSSEFGSTTIQPDIVLKDVQFGAASIIYGTHTAANLGTSPSIIAIENFNKVLNSHKVYIWDIGTITKNDCTGEPVARTGGGTSVAEFLLNTGTYAAQTKAPAGMSSVGFCPAYIEMKVWLSSSQLTNANFKFYVQSVTDALTSDTFWLECEYIDVSTAQGYHKKIITSTESITARANASDWTQFISTGNFTPAVAGWVTIRIFDNLYSANKKYVDPMYDGCIRQPLWSVGSPDLSLENVSVINLPLQIAPKRLGF